MATAYGMRASEFMQLETELGAWALDEACLMVGRKFENLLNEGKSPFGLAAQAKDGYAPAPKHLIKKAPLSTSTLTSPQMQSTHLGGEKRK